MFDLHYLFKTILVLSVFSFSLIGYGQEIDTLDYRPITRETLENALGGGFIVDKIKGIELKLGGHLQADAIFDTHKTGSSVFFKPSQISLPSERYPRTLFSIMDSRLRFTASNTEEEFSGHLKMLLEFDFRNAGTAPRMRHAWLEIGNFGIGQTWSNIIDTDAFPNIILNNGGPNSFSVNRSLQFRYSFKVKEDQISIAVEDHAPQVTIPDSWDARQVFPNLTAAYKKNFGRNHLRLAVLLNPIDYNDEFNSENLKTLFGYAASLTGKMDFGRDNLKFHATYGSGNSGYMEDLNKTRNEAVVIDNKLKTVDLFSGWIFYEHLWSDRFSSIIGYGLNDLGKNSAETEDKINKTQMAICGFQYQPLNQFKVVFEGIYGHRENYATDEFGKLSGHDIRLQFTTLYVF